MSNEGSLTELASSTILRHALLPLSPPSQRVAPPGLRYPFQPESERVVHFMVMGDCSFAHTTSSKYFSDPSFGMKIADTIYLCTLGICNRYTPSWCSVASEPNRPEFVFIYRVGTSTPYGDDSLCYGFQTHLTRGTVRKTILQ